MNGGSRHTACKYCRDRKVRCDGEQPACEKCRRAGEECIYLPTQRPSRADLTQTIEGLQNRLGEAEARISRMARQPGASVPQVPPSYSAPAWPMTSKYSAPAVFHCPLPPFTSAGADGGPAAGQSAYPALFYQSHQHNSSGLFNDFLDSLQPGSPRAITGRNDSVHLSQEEEEENHDNSDVDLSTKLGFPALRGEGRNHQGEGFVDVDTMASSGSRATASSSALVQDTAQGAKSSDDRSAAIVSHVATFSSAIFHSQAEIAGIAHVVAQYIAWMRQVPQGIAPPNTSLVYVNVLETVEERLREMRELAQTRPKAAFRDLVTALEELGVAGDLGELEEEFQRRSADVANFFQTRYNACALLSEQTQNVPHGPAAGKERSRSASS